MDCERVPLESLVVVVSRSYKYSHHHLSTIYKAQRCNILHTDGVTYLPREPILPGLTTGILSYESWLDFSASLVLYAQPDHLAEDRHTMPSTTATDGLAMSPLGKLPPELRLIIYELAIIRSETIDVTLSPDQTHIVSGKWSAWWSLQWWAEKAQSEHDVEQVLSTSTVCKQVRREMIALIYGQSRSCVHVAGPGFLNLLKSEPEP